MAKFEPVKYIWMSGELVPWEEAKVHVLTHALHYASAVFEGTRCYKTEKGPAVFRLSDHNQRLINSAKIYRMELPWTREEIDEACLDLIRKNELEDCYIRPLVYRGYHSLGVSPFECPVELSIAVWRWGRYLGPEALEKGVDVMVSSWARMAPDTLPAMAKATGNYADAQLIKMEAILYGFTEGIALNHLGAVSEGSGENLFLVKDGEIHTPSLDAAILPGITRATIKHLATEMGYTVKEIHIPREMLYLADELFFTGTAAEVTPIRSVDKIQIGEGRIGPVTKRIQKAYLDAVNWKNEDHPEWLTPVYG
jgi:branched-chain amino acid aminotransferase